MKSIIGSEKAKNSLGSRLLRYRCMIISFIIVYPYLVGFSPDSTSTSGTIIDILIGTGRHSNVSYDCSGNPISAVNYSTHDYGISASHHLEAFKFGVKAGGYSIKITEKINYSGYNYYYNDEPTQGHNSNVFYVNPFLGVETQYFALIAGISVFTEEATSQEIASTMRGHIADFLMGSGNTQPTWFLRIGNKAKFHFSTEYLSNTPLFSGGGIGDIGFGFGSTESRNLTWIGASVGPYQKLGIALKQDIEASQRFDILLRGRAGSAENNFEGAFSAGIRFNF